VAVKARALQIEAVVLAMPPLVEAVEKAKEATSPTLATAEIIVVSPTLLSVTSVTMIVAGISVILVSV
jgi:hypothetical protein